MRILFNVFVVFCLFFSAESITNVRHSIECEHEELTLKCENNKVLNILDGNYGRTTSSTCMKGGNNNVTCYQENSLAVLSDLCEGRSECSVNANNDVFGDPCPGTVKYLFVLYRCVSIEEYKYSLSCENKPVHLDCPKGKVIQIHGANYGRRSQITCTDGPIKTTNCVSDLSADIVSRLCNNKKSCVLMANNNVFGDPCVGTYKYLSVKYKCVPGLDDCTSKLSSNQDIQCLDGSTIVPSMLCDGKKDCPYGDDELTCSYDTKFACEHNKLEMKCKKDETIKIINANYGRTSWKVCPQKDIKDDMDCRAGTSTQIVQQKCAGKHKCEIKANNNIFGDPCSGIVKYLEVNFECEPNAGSHKVVPRSV